ncbi:hypothetical protein NM208_g14588 [Fusarium decemcellulare]|uniref:Uncharacterized protein n=1 Tax=Fusarium decemcellulare TaxID=57161 RepID=A0ACC1RGN9_9HYPO|nr:hypothetical protein NM208_g14588 [Fusarium decemcellulare]
MEARNYWQCPTCKFSYRISRLHWSSTLSSKWAQIGLTFVFCILSIFVLGFIADPLFDLWSDPIGTIGETVTSVVTDIEAMRTPLPQEPTSWIEHFIKGFFSLGIVGLFKTMVSVNPFHWWQLRNSGIAGGGRRQGTGRNRVENINLIFVLIGAFTFLMGIWKAVQKLSARVLKNVSDRVLDVGEDDDDDDDDEGVNDGPSQESPSGSMSWSDICESDTEMTLDGCSRIPAIPAAQSPGISRGERPYHEHVPSGSPPVVILTVLDNRQYSSAYLKSIQNNRELYASRHGYEALVVKATDYPTEKSPRSWAKIIAMRHALSLYPDAKFIWFLDQNAYIMDLDRSLEEQVTNPAKLESLMIKDWPIVPPDSIIKTFTHLKGNDAALIISQDDSGLVVNSMVLRNGDWAKFFVETWMDPLYRSYNFQKAERHALRSSRSGHLPRYGRNKEGNAYRDGDFVTLMVDCTITGAMSCEKLSHYYQQQLTTKYGVAAAAR